MNELNMLNAAIMDDKSNPNVEGVGEIITNGILGKDRHQMYVDLADKVNAEIKEIVTNFENAEFYESDDDDFDDGDDHSYDLNDLNGFDEELLRAEVISDAGFSETLHDLFNSPQFVSQLMMFASTVMAEIDAAAYDNSADIEGDDEIYVDDIEGDDDDGELGDMMIGMDACYIPEASIADDGSLTNFEEGIDLGPLLTFDVAAGQWFLIERRLFKTPGESAESDCDCACDCDCGGCEA